jgi:hypothetical protein
VWIADFVSCYNARSDRTEAIHGFSQEPLASVFLELPISRRHVVGHCESENIVLGRGGLNVFPLFANDDSQFRFPIQLLFERNNSKYVVSTLGWISIVASSHIV